jgi:hypothetical protein
VARGIIGIIVIIGSSSSAALNVGCHQHRHRVAGGVASAARLKVTSLAALVASQCSASRGISAHGLISLITSALARNIFRHQHKRSALGKWHLAAWRS